MLKKICIIVACSFLSGCMAQMQENMNALQSYWEKENSKLVSELGTRYYKLGVFDAQRAMLIALSNLEMSIEQQDSNSGFIVAKANAPHPLSTDEWLRVKDIEEPNAQKIAGPMFILDGTKSEVIINTIILKREHDIQITIRFRTKYIGNTAGLIIGRQPPPEAVKIGLRKIWNEFEKTVFIQGKVLGRSR